MWLLTSGRNICQWHWKQAALPHCRARALDQSELSQLQLRDCGPVWVEKKIANLGLMRSFQEPLDNG